jgi:acyl-CoA thioesterase I
MTCWMLASCNSTEKTPEKEVEPAAVPAAKADNRPVIACFGDSLTEVNLDSGQSYTDFLQKTLDQKGYAYRVVNLGISGDTTTGGLGRIQSAIDLKPQIVLLELGGNDGLRGIPIASSRANLESMIQQLQTAKIQVVLAGMTLPPNYGPEYIRGFEAMYRDLAKKYKLTLIPFLLEGIRQQLATTPGLLNRDGIHPTPKGNVLVASTVMETLEPLLQSH